jgi:hypothetical protein
VRSTADEVDVWVGIGAHDLLHALEYTEWSPMGTPAASFYDPPWTTLFPPSGAATKSRCQWRHVDRLPLQKRG